MRAMMDATSYNKNVQLERVWNKKLSVVVILALSFFVSFCRTRLIVAWVKMSYSRLWQDYLSNLTFKVDEIPLAGVLHGNYF